MKMKLKDNSFNEALCLQYGVIRYDLIILLLADMMDQFKAPAFRRGR
jgi:hypothetical protein